jgi:D-alanyl-D-alanine carboxypeptidase/D-alanyl-D-alanine-endopeptidase (penicillin-binding protein 4)
MSDPRDSYDDGQWGDDRIEVVAEPQRFARGPLIALILIAIVPAVALFLVRQWADREADEYELTNSATVLDADLSGQVASQGSAPATNELDESADRGAEGAQAPRVAPVLATGVFDYRRAPELVSAATSASQLRVAVDQVLSFIGPDSCAAVSVDGAPVTSANPNLPVIPASNQKLLVASAALDVLGDGHTFTTSVAVPSLNDGTVDGDLFLVGGGDPMLISGAAFPPEGDRPPENATSLDALADLVVDAGVDRITGAVLGDGSKYDDEFFVPGWADDVPGVDAGPYDALLVNDARLAGNTTVENEPNEAAAVEFERLLRERGVQIAGGVGIGQAPEAAGVIASIESAALSDIVGEMLLTSDNNTAELLVKEIGVSASGAGTRAAGLEAVFQSLADQGVPMDGVELRDGSGLSAANRVTCAAVLDVLQLAEGGPIDAGLPVASLSGTLANEFGDSAMVGRLRAKTGTLNNAPDGVPPPPVKALAGYVDPLVEDGPGTIQFVLIANGETFTDVDIYRPLWDALGQRFATYPAGPPADLLGPR